MKKEHLSREDLLRGLELYALPRRAPGFAALQNEPGPLILAA
jgi:hypothetical protein